jgi:hypothetical protein
VRGKKEPWMDAPWLRVGNEPELLSFNQFERLKAHMNRSHAQKTRRRLERLAREYGLPVWYIRKLYRADLRRRCRETLAKHGIYV